MLVANPNQTTSYALHSKKACHPCSNVVATNSNSSNSKSIKNVISNVGNKNIRNVLANNCGGGMKLPPPTVKNITATTISLKHNIVASHNLGSNTTTATDRITNGNSSGVRNSVGTGFGITDTTGTSSTLMKSLSVRLNRGTEFLKETVQKTFIAKIPTHLSSVLNFNLYTVPPTATHRFPAERLNANSTDSLQTEMCHFMPIRTAPTTPWKNNSKSRGGATLKMPKACLAKKVHLNPTASAGADETIVGTESHLQFRPKPNSTLLTTIFTTPERKSAFVCLVAKMKTATNTESMASNISLFNSHITKNAKTTKKPRRGRKQPKADALFRKSTDTKMLANELLRPKQQSAMSRAYKSYMTKQAEIIKIRSSKRTKNNANVSRSSNNTSEMLMSGKRATKTSVKAANVNANEKIKAKTNDNNKSNNNSCGRINNPKGRRSNNDDGKQGGNQTAKSRRELKRKPTKIPYEDNADKMDTQLDHGQPPTRKSTRLSKGSNTGKNFKLVTSHNNSNERKIKRPKQKRETTSRSSVVFTPPLTRSRLKQILESKLI